MTVTVATIAATVAQTVAYTLAGCTVTTAIYENTCRTAYHDACDALDDRRDARGTR